MTGRAVIYGAYGATGRLIARAAKQRGHEPILAGRDGSQLRSLAEELDLEYCVARLDDASALDAALGSASVLLNAAGPFTGAAGAMLDACLRSGVHYLDISGEVSWFESAARRHRAALERGVMIMPGVGFDVVTSDCLAALVATELPEATSLAIGISGLELLSRGSARTLMRHAGRPLRVRRNGKIVSVRPGRLTHHFDYGKGPSESWCITWGDVSSAYYSTAIPNITVYFDATPRVRSMLLFNRYFGRLLTLPPWQVALSAYADVVADTIVGEEPPTAVVAEARDGRGRVARARLSAPGAYQVTEQASIAITERVLGDQFEPGFRTPSSVYGAGFVGGLHGVTVEQVAS